jgi:enterochelin esterase family protein
MNRTFALAIALLVSFAVQARAEDTGSMAEIRVSYEQYFEALRHKDMAGVTQMLDPDFTLELADGTTLTRDQRAEQLEQMVRHVKAFGSVSNEIEPLRIAENETVVTVRTRVFYTVPDYMYPAKGIESFSDDRTQDTWIRTARGWKIKASRQIRSTVRGRVTPAEVPPDSPRLAALAREWKSGKRAALDAFWKDIGNRTPLVEEIESDTEDLFVTFLWRDDRQTQKIALVGGLPQDSDKLLSRLADTDVWYRTERLPKDARGTYAFKVEGTLTQPKELHFTATVPDPLNPRAFWYGSVFELPKAEPQAYINDQAITPKGMLRKLKIKSKILNEEREYGVYTPPGFDPNASPYKLLVLFDGETYGNGPDPLVPAPVILDNLIAQKKVVPMVLLLVNYVSGPLRARDLACWEPFENFLAGELIPSLRRDYNISSDPADTIVGGSSAGGLAAACSGLMHPEVFGNILSQSGSYGYVPDWRKAETAGYSAETGWVIQEFAKRAKLPLRFYLETGRFDSPGEMVAVNRHLRDVLQLKGYPVMYSEFDGGHDYLCWRGTLAQGLIFLAGNDRRGQGEEPQK